MQTPKLIALEPYVKPELYEIKDDICTLGRSETCQVVVDLNTVSRMHAKIEFDGGRYVLHDANSANGTYDNGRRHL
jgi:pSer/pThr/pTyr-binding forkhead associated (FHA) protein